MVITGNYLVIRSLDEKYPINSEGGDVAHRRFDLDVERKKRGLAGSREF